MLRTYFGRSGQANLKSMQPKRCDHSPMRLLAKTAPSIGVFLSLDLPMKLQCIWTFTSSTAQGGGGSFKNRKPVGEVGCESGMAERSHWWTERCLISLSLSLFLSFSLCFSLFLWLSTYLPTYWSIYLPIYLGSISCLYQCFGTRPMLSSMLYVMLWIWRFVFHVNFDVVNLAFFSSRKN